MKSASSGWPLIRHDENQPVPVISAAPKGCLLLNPSFVDETKTDPPNVEIRVKFESSYVSNRIIYSARHWIYDQELAWIEMMYSAETHWELTSCSGNHRVAMAGNARRRMRAIAIELQRSDPERFLFARSFWAWRFSLSTATLIHISKTSCSSQASFLIPHSMAYR